MGVHLSPDLIALMSSADQARYGVAPTSVHVTSDGKTSRRRDADERKEQGTFASWLLLQNSKRGPNEKIPFVWHATHKPSKATPGTPDFYVGINGRSIWFEFKRDESCKLSPEQEEFRVCCVYQEVEWHLVHSAAEAIQLVKKPRSYRERLDQPIRAQFRGER